MAEVTLHVGLGTFAPLRAAKLERIQLHEERFEISAAAAQIMREATRIFCVGTTSVRTLETAMLHGGLRADERRYESLYLSGLSLSGHRRAAHQFSSAGIELC